MDNEARRAELAITNLISNKREWNNCYCKNTSNSFLGASIYISLHYNYIIWNYYFYSIASFGGIF